MSPTLTRNSDVILTSGRIFNPFVAFGSSCQTLINPETVFIPSGGRAKLTSQVSLACFIGRLSTSQLLKSPTKNTLPASGASKLNRTFLVLGLASWEISFSLFFSSSLYCFRSDSSTMPRSSIQNLKETPKERPGSLSLEPNLVLFQPKTDYIRRL